MESLMPTEEHTEDVLRIHRVEVGVGIAVGRLGALAEHIAVGIALRVMSGTPAKPDARRSRVASARHSMCCRPPPHA